MTDVRFIHKIRLKNFLSYGSKGTTIDLKPLNLIIGANGAGKSNFVEAIRLLGLTPVHTGLTVACNQAGGISELIWKGASNAELAEIEVITTAPNWEKRRKGIGLRYKISITNNLGQVELVEETIEEIRLNSKLASKSVESNKIGKNKLGYNKLASGFYGTVNYDSQAGQNGDFNDKNKGQELLYQFLDGITILNYRSQHEGANEFRRRPISLASNNLTVLSELKDPKTYPEITYLGNKLNQIAIFRGWKFTPGMPPKKPAIIGKHFYFLHENGDNLALVLENLLHQPDVKRQIIDKMQLFYREFEDFEITLKGRGAQIFIREKGLSKLIPATRLSDGILRYICLLTILCHPSPPALICLEEPEVGLNPEMVPIICNLLVEASKRMQIIATTHSESMVSAFREKPECLIHCEREETGSKLMRVQKDQFNNLISKFPVGKVIKDSLIDDTYIN
jgi:predicted ATPase